MKEETRKNKFLLVDFLPLEKKHWRYRHRKEEKTTKIESMRRRTNLAQWWVDSNLVVWRRDNECMVKMGYYCENDGGSVVFGWERFKCRMRWISNEENQTKFSFFLLILNSKMRKDLAVFSLFGNDPLFYFLFLNKWAFPSVSLGNRSPPTFLVLPSLLCNIGRWIWLSLFNLLSLFSLSYY